MMNAVLYKLRVGKIRWKLRVVMAERKITNKALAEFMGRNPVSIAKLKSVDELPEIGGDTLAKLCEGIASLSNRSCLPSDLIEYIADEDSNLQK